MLRHLNTKQCWISTSGALANRSKFIFYHTRRSPTSQRQESLQNSRKTFIQPYLRQSLPCTTDLESRGSCLLRHNFRNSASELIKLATCGQTPHSVILLPWGRLSMPRFSLFVFPCATDGTLWNFNGICKDISGSWWRMPIAKKQKERIHNLIGNQMWLRRDLYWLCAHVQCLWCLLLRCTSTRSSTYPNIRQITSALNAHLIHDITLS